MIKQYLSRDISTGMPAIAGRQLAFPLGRLGYVPEAVLNNKNRHHIKLVCTVRSRNEPGRFVSTTYARHNDYLRFIEATTYLKCNNKILPGIARLYPRQNTAVCRYMGSFLSDCLVDNRYSTSAVIGAVFCYMEETSRLNRRPCAFTTPSIIRTSIDLSREFSSSVDLLSESRETLSRLEKKKVNFIYGCGVEDPHIWNYRVINNGVLKALTTDFDYFSDKINYFWELGYFYATLRWLRDEFRHTRNLAEGDIISILNNRDPKSEFMFWLGVLSSYCGYRDSICSFLSGSKQDDPELEERCNMIKWLDKKVSFLAGQLL